MQAFISASHFSELRAAFANVDRAYTFADLSSYSLRDRLSIQLADIVFFGLIKLIGGTLKFAVEGWENHEAVINANKLPVYTFWHDRIFTTTYWWRNCHGVVLTSRSFDGEYIARFIQRFGYGAVRGSSTRGGIGAVVEMARLMRAGCPTCFVVDGPKGPPHVVKLGAVVLAKKTGHPILPVTMALSRFWTLPSWDRFQIPKPFARAKIFVSEPIYVPENSDEVGLEAKRAQLQRALDDLAARSQQWRTSL